MRIASKINVALLSAFACATLGSFAVMQTTIQPQFNEIERNSALLNHKRVTDAFDAASEKLQTATQDYAFWDETYNFMQGENEEDFITSNMTPDVTAVLNLGVNSLIFQSKDGTVRWGRAYDMETKEPIEGLVKEIARFSRSHPHLSGGPTETTRGLIHTSKGPVLLAIAPALRSDRSGPAVGRIISAKILNAEAIQQLTGVNFKIESLPKLFAASELSNLMANIALDTLPNEIETTSVVKNIVGRPLMYLKTYTARDVSRTGAIAIHSAMVMMVLAALGAMAILWIYLNSAMVARIEGLKAHFTTVSSSGELKPAPVGSANDELTELSKSFNVMADQVNHLRDALADSAYMSGLSEWAAGTLHNVRNGLVPISAATWQTEQLLSGPWIKNVEIAAAEYADPATPEDRRAKLSTFLVGSSARFADAAKQTRELTEGIKTASKEVLGMVAEFERYAHRKTELEPLELLSLIKVAAAASIESRAKYTELVLPAQSAKVFGNGVILRQIVSNILVNAVEAMDNQSQRNRIVVSISPSESHPGFTRLAIADNGEGLAPERLTEIFKRGVSSRSTRAGGLGLHWCANAINVLGGSIHAESDGPGLGATIVMELPNFDLAKEAAA